MIKTQYKKAIRNELTNLGVELMGGYHNDTCDVWNRNKTTSRRIKVGISRELSEIELGTLQGALGNTFGCKVDAKNYDYYGSTVVLYLRKRK